MTFCDKSVLSPQCDDKSCKKCYPSMKDKKLEELLKEVDKKYNNLVDLPSNSQEPPITKQEEVKKDLEHAYNLGKQGGRKKVQNGPKVRR